MNAQKSGRTRLLIGGMILLAVLVMYQSLQGRSSQDAALLDVFGAKGADAAVALATRVSAPARVVVLSMDTKDEPLLDRQIKGFIAEAQRSGLEVLAHETASGLAPEFEGQSHRLREDDYLKLRQQYAEADVIVAFDLYPEVSADRIKDVSGLPRLAVLTVDPYEVEKWVKEGIATWVIAPPVGAAANENSEDPSSTSHRYFLLYDGRPSTP